MVGQRLVLDEAVANLLIGSDPSCDFYLPHDSVSPIHARLWVDLEGTVLHDTSSPHGLYVNDERVVGKHELHNGDIVWLGSPGGANVVMIQCVLADNPAETEEAALAEPPSAGADEREAIESLAPTLAAGPTLADFDGPTASEGSVPMWDEEPPPIPEPAQPPPDTDEDSGRTQAFKLPADFAAAFASPPPIPRAATSPPAEPREPPPVPASPTRSDEIESLVAEPELQPDMAVLPEDETLVDADAYTSELEPALAAPAPPPAEPEPYVAAESEPEIIEPNLPEPETTHMIFASDAPPAPAPAASDVPADFDDMMFSVPDEAPAAAPAPPSPAPPAAQAAPPEPPSDETVLLASVPRPAPAPPSASAAPVAAQPPAMPPVPPRPAAPKPPPARAAAPPVAISATRPASARPAVRAERAATPSATPSKRLPMAALAVAGVLAVVVLAAGYWFLGRSEPAQTAANTEAPPSTVPATLAAPVTTLAAGPEPAAEPTPEPTPEAAAVAPAENVVTIVRTASPPPRAPSAAPTAAALPRPVEARRPDPVDPAAATRARLAAQVTTLLGQAQSAASARNYDAALVQYDEALRLDPQNAAAQAGKTSATAARAHARKSFVAGRTVVRTEKAGGGLAGFDSSGVNLQKAPDFQGRVEYAMTPASVQPGDPWELKIYVVNEGKKAIKIAALDVATVVNGAPSGTGGAPRNREIAPQQRVIVDQLSGTWPSGVTSWRAEVKVTAGKNDSLQSQLTWR
jgi:hypothetical protein